MLEDEEPVDVVALDDEPDDVPPPSEDDLLSEPLPLLAAGALLEDEPRLSVR